jgi:hypothetical protein
MSKTVKGRVLDSSDRNPLPYTNVFIVDSSGKVTDPPIGTTTDQNGFFSINVPSGMRVAFSHVGYARTTIKPETRDAVVLMKESSTELDPVIVRPMKQAHPLVYAGLGIGILALATYVVTQLD